jgi:hypothetical protein
MRRRHVHLDFRIHRNILLLNIVLVLFGLFYLIRLLSSAIL